EYALDSNNDDTNFVITDDNTVSGAKTKFRNNINAIKTLKALELNGKAATNADKKALSLYTGWGGLAPAFSENPAWKNEAQELMDLLTADEYVSARASTLDAFYTDNTIIDGIYQALRKFGFTGGDVLEPAMGIGNFFGRMPSDISRSSRLYGVEKGSISGRIASKLYPDASITVDGFENTQFQNGSFDVAVGNIPFGDSSVNDKEYNSQHLKIHDYFFLKTLDKVRPGGIVAFVTSKGTLDKKDTSFRKSLAERADLLGAVRLPNNAFKSAGTQVTSDIIFLQKRTAPPEKLPEWVQLGATSDGLSVNQYFASHPDMVLGKIVQGNKMYGRNDDTMCIPFDDADLSRLLPEAINKISGSYTPDFDKPSPLQDIKNQDVVLPENIRQESYFVHNGELYFWGVAGRDVEIIHARELWSNYSAKNRKYNNKNIERTKAFVELREIVRELLEVQKLPGDYSKRISELQKELNEKYDAFYSKFGLLHAQQNRLLLSRDSAYPLLLSLEAEVDKGKLIRKSDIFTERTISPPIAVEHVDTALEALNVSIVSLGEIDLDYMSELCDIPKRVIIEQLRGQIYPVPELSTDDNIVYQTASEYLSGDIYIKLDAAKDAAEANPLFEDNIPALKEAIPTPLKSGDIDVNIGATWIEPKYYQQFIYEIFETPDEYRADIKPRFIWQRTGKKIEVEYSKYSNKWQITNKSLDKSVTVTKQLGTQFKSAYSIFESILNLNDPRVYKDAVDKNGKIIFDKSGNPVRVLDVERTKLLQQKANIIKRKFKDWIFKDPRRRSELVAKYNREFNCIKPREFDGSHLTFPGMNSSIELRSHQKNAIAHAIFGGNTLFAHAVGAGKSATRS
ncbi:MAG: N-6 DNA methylase, partial [Acutalibacteraceae bacterium]